MTPRREQLSPKSVLAWLKQTRKLIERRGNDKAVKFQVHYMFKYIEQLVEYQDPLPPQIDSEDGSQFTCRRCKKAMKAGQKIIYFVRCAVRDGKEKDNENREFKTNEKNQSDYRN